MLLESIGETIHALLWDEPQRVLFERMGNDFHLRSEEIPNQLGDFQTALTALLGAGSPVLVRAIIRKLCSNLGIPFVRKDEHDLGLRSRLPTPIQSQTRQRIMHCFSIQCLSRTLGMPSGLPNTRPAQYRTVTVKEMAPRVMAHIATFQYCRRLEEQDGRPAPMISSRICMQLTSVESIYLVRFSQRTDTRALRP
jgi:hypothetical protein